MKRLTLTLLSLLSAAFSVTAQTDWKTIDKLMDDGSYQSAYAQAEAVYKKPAATSRQRLTAAFYMAQAAAAYQEDARDSAEARFRALLPQLDPLDQALCHAFLGQYDSALVDAALLQATPVEQVRQFCDNGKTRNMTPTVYDMLVVMMQDRGNLSPKERVEWQRRLCRLHQGQDAADLTLWHTLRLLSFMEQVPNRPLSTDTILAYLDRYRHLRSPYVTGLYHMMAFRCNSQGDYVAAVRWCDSAIARYPKSEGGVDCANLRSEITAPRIALGRNPHYLVPQRAELMGVTYRNATRLYLRLVNEPDEYLTDAQLAKLKPLREWSVDLPPHTDYQEATACFTLPQLPTGRYRLLAAPSANFAKGLAYQELHVTDMVLRYTAGGRGLLVDRATGAPIVGQKVSLISPKDYRGHEERLLQTVVTSADGTFNFDSLPQRSSFIRIERGGYSLQQSVYNRGGYNGDKMQTHINLVADRPIYHPGDTVQVAATLYRSDGLDGALLEEGHPLEVVLRDPNHKEVQRQHLVTDDFGTASSRFVLPVDRLAGQWTVEAVDSSNSSALYLRVEEYKQPRFMVSLDVDGEAPGFGQPCILQGMAAAYSGVPVGGARVQYTVTRTRYFFRWGNGRGGEIVAEGETTANADGSFSISFVPQPDSSIDFASRPVFSYQVEAIVTDLNGESHNATAIVRVGFRHLYLGAKDLGSTLRELNTLGISLTDLNGRQQAGHVRVAVERLRRPEPMCLVPSALSDGTHQLTDSTEYARLFPYYVYNKAENDRSRWTAEWRWETETDSDAVSLPPLQGGIYRIVLSILDGSDTLYDTAYTVLTPAADRLMRDDDLLWADRDGSMAHPGERYTFRLGSAYEGVRAWYGIEYGDGRQLRSGWITLGQRLQTLTVDVDSAMLGGFSLTLMTVYQGQTDSKCYVVDVPFDHKKLQVEIETFRDRLLPGEQEQWTIKVKGESEKVKGESQLIMTMYDDALNSYGTTERWGLSPWRGHNPTYWSLYDTYFAFSYYSGVSWRGYNGTYPSVWSLKEALPYYNRWRGGRIMYKSAAANMVELSVVEEDVAVMDNAVQMASAKAAGAEAVEEVVVEEEIYSIAYNEPAPEVRTNLGTLAFFAPAIRTDADGTATYRFTVPELLTRWDLKALALTRDLCSGTLERTLVTAKPLMVQPNMPRFLRSGDSLSLMAKVVVAEPKEPVDVTVTFLLTDAATGDVICRQRQHTVVKDATQVMFDVEVPPSVYVATYEIRVDADGMSDGERGQLPVVTNRQAVTVSQALYINGAGEKHFHFPMPDPSDTRMPNLLAAEVVSNPLWLAVKVMPYMKNLQNPSTIYLAEQLYVNGLGKNVLVEIEKSNLLEILDTSQKKESPLALNADVKQTLLQATPWVQAAESEEEQMRAVANYLDTSAINAQLATLGSQLAQRQNADGGWPWMPEGKSSLWATQQILQKLSTQYSTLNTKNALAYIDREQQRHYERYIKPYVKKYKWAPDNIDYLYTRSLFGKASTEAYRFYYSNVLKHYRDYDNLYTQAQLALIFHRHGDRKEALDLLRRLKEKSLTSDEMGLYWRDNRPGWCWYQRPIETQALLIRAFSEITPSDTLAIAFMQQWLLKQKQTTHWGNSHATAEAISALMPGEGYKVKGETNITMTVLGAPLTAHHSPLTSQRWSGDSLDSILSLGDNSVTLRKSTPGIAWGAVHYQYTDDIDKIPATESGLTLVRSYEHLPHTSHPSPLKVGDRITVRLEITVDRPMDYLELVDGRPSCLEPVSTRAGWQWCDGIGCYKVVNQTDTRFYIEHLEKGHYTLTYDLYVTNPGSFLSGVASLQCLYAPEFRALAPAVRLTVQ